jgi:hypothetical protein
MEVSKFVLIVGLSALISACSEDRGERSDSDNSDESKIVNFMPSGLHCSELMSYKSEPLPNWKNEGALEVNDSYYLALEVGQTLLPKESLYTKIGNDLELIRGLFYNDTATASSVLPCAMLPLQLHINSSDYQNVKYGQYAEWQEINEELGVSKINYSNLQYTIELEFEREFNATLVKEIYQNRDLRGLQDISTNSAFSLGQDVCSEHSGDDRYYVFWQGEGDCLAGCIQHKYSGYKIEDENRVTHLGTFEYSQTEGKAPQWFAELKQCPIQLQHSNVAN